MTAVHPNHINAVHNDPRPTSSNGFNFPKSGLGTPDFYYFGGGGSGEASTPSWLKQSTTAEEETVKLEEENNIFQSDTLANSTSNSHNDIQSHLPPDQKLAEPDDPSRIRASSDPLVRQTPDWVIQKTKLDQEPNPFERSFSGKTPYEVVASYRRARSQSPKSSHGHAASHAHSQSHSTLNPANNRNNNNNNNNTNNPLTSPPSLNNNVKLPPFESLNTPSAEYGNFAWPLGDQSLRSGPLSPRMLNGPTYGTSHTNFDPASIRTGLTPGGPLASMTAQYTPHSPATQALFAMMTNQTPGLPSLPKIEPHEDQLPLHRHNYHHRVSGSQQSSDSRSSLSPIQRNAAQHTSTTNNVYSQSIPRQTYLNARSPPSQAHARRPSDFLQQVQPRPLPAQAFNGTGAGTKVQPSNAAAAAAGTSTNGGSNLVPPNSSHQNPLYLLSQAHAHLSSDNLSSAQDIQGTDDAVLAAAAGLSGLSTPRPTYVGGPSASIGLSSIAPTHLNVSTSTNLALPNSNSGANSNSSIPVQSLKENNVPVQHHQSANGGSGGGGGRGRQRSRRKNAQHSKDPTTRSNVNMKKVKRNSTTARRAAATNVQPIVDEDTLDEGSEMDDYDEMLMKVDMDVDEGKGETRRKRRRSESLLHVGKLEEEDNDQSMNRQSSHTGAGSGDKVSGKQAFETEEEKRKSFLERNRQAALKCRQRKKQWLSQLQAKVEYLSQDNDSLQQTVAQLRQEIANLRSILVTHKDCPASIGSIATGAGSGGIGGGGTSTTSENTITALLAAQQAHAQSKNTSTHNHNHSNQQRQQPY